LVRPSFVLGRQTLKYNYLRPGGRLLLLFSQRTIQEKTLFTVATDLNQHRGIYVYYFRLNDPFINFVKRSVVKCEYETKRNNQNRRPITRRRFLPSVVDETIKSPSSGGEINLLLLFSNVRSNINARKFSRDNNFWNVRASRSNRFNEIKKPLKRNPFVRNFEPETRKRQRVNVLLSVGSFNSLRFGDSRWTSITRGSRTVRRSLPTIKTLANERNNEPGPLGLTTSEQQPPFQFSYFIGQTNVP